MAAGLSIRRDNLAAFQARFESVAAAELPIAELGPEQRVDLEIDLLQADDDLERLCRHLEPCGMGNPAPVFGVRGVGFAGRQRVGVNHLRGILRAGEGGLGAIGFQLADRVPWLADDPVDAAFRLEQNEYRGTSALQARLLSLSPHRPTPPAAPSLG
jgi:single-stranded-DNA-specific exonuclease